MRKNRGITLIALIITIIVLLILTAVAVDVAIDGKLFDKAQEAVDKTNDKVAQQQNRADELMVELEKYEEHKFSLYEQYFNGTEWVEGDYIGTFDFEADDTWADFIGDEVISVEGLGEVTGVVYNNVAFYINEGQRGEFHIGLYNEEEDTWWNCNSIKYQDDGKYTVLNEPIINGAEYMIYNPD